MAARFSLVKYSNLTRTMIACSILIALHFSPIWSLQSWLYWRQFLVFRDIFSDFNSWYFYMSWDFYCIFMVFLWGNSWYFYLGNRYFGMIFHCDFTSFPTKGETCQSWVYKKRANLHYQQSPLQRFTVFSMCIYVIKTCVLHIYIHILICI